MGYLRTNSLVIKKQKLPVTMLILLIISSLNLLLGPSSLFAASNLQPAPTAATRNQLVQLPPLLTALPSAIIPSISGSDFNEELKLPASEPAPAIGNNINQSNKTALLLQQLKQQLLLPAASSNRNQPTSDATATRAHQSASRAPELQQQMVVSRLRGQVNGTLTGSGSLNGGNFSLGAVRQRWRQMELSVGESLASLSAQLGATLAELSPKAGLSPGCRQALDELTDGLAHGKLWASQMVDASAHRLPSGLLEGTLTELGHYDQCLALSYQRGDDSSSSDMREATPYQRSMTTTGQYCSLQVKPPLTARARLHTVCQRLPALSSSAGSANSSSNAGSKTLKLISQHSHHFYYAGIRLGVCTPSKCHKADVQLLLSAYLAKFQLLGQVKSCQVLSGEEGTQKFDSIQQSIIFILLGLISLTALGTLIDLISERKSEPRRRPLIAAPSARMDKLLAGAHQKRQPSCTSMPRSLGSDDRVEVMDLSSGSSNSDQRGQQRVARVGGNSADGGKRWLYQVYRPPPPPASVCRLHRKSVNPQLDYLVPPGVQRNPLASGVGLAEPLAASAKDNGAGHFSTLHSCPRMMEEREVDEELDEAEAEEEAWVAQLERNQAAVVANHLPGGYQFGPTFGADPGHRQHRYKSRKSFPVDATSGRSKFKASFRDFMVCFSLRANLKLIGRHVSSASSNQQLEQELRASGAAGFKPSSISSSESSAAGGDDIKVIHGIRTITMIWIIFGHTIGLVNPEMMNNLFSVAQLSCSSRLLQALLNATLAVNTFYMISGLVTAVSLARRCPSACRLLTGSTGATSSAAATGKIGQSKLLQSRAQFYGGAKQIRGHGRRKLATDLDSSSSVDSSSMHSSSLDSSLAAAAAARGLRTPQMGGVAGPVSSLLAAGAQRLPTRNRKLSSGQKPLLLLSAMSPREQQQLRAGSGGWPRDFQPIIWLIMRYLRLTPAYATTIGLSVLLPTLGSGPFWQESAGQLGATCRLNWWSNLIYANNFINTDKLCLIHSWYLSNDWQFFVITLILLAVGYKSKRLAILLMVTLFIGSSAATFALTVANEFPPTIVSTSPAVAERWLFIHSLYYKPWPHFTSYLIGLITGYLLVIKDRIRLSGTWRLINWCSFSLLALALLNSIYPWNMGIQVEPLITGLHSSTFRTLWAACCAWLVFGLATRPQGPLAKLLSWHGFQVSSRLTYCAYLVHPLIIYYHFGTLRERMDSSVYGQSHRFMATLLMSYLGALLLSLLVESPSIQLQRLLASATRGGSERQSGAMATAHRRRGDSSSSGVSSTNSWSQTSSFGDQNSAGNGSNSSSAGPLVASVADLNLAGSAQPLAEEVAGGKQQRPISAACCATSGLHNQPAGAGAAAWAAHEQSTAAALDADFQRKLAQAIGRGFRIRSKLAASSNGSSRCNQAASGHLPGSSRPRSSTSNPTAVQPPVVPSTSSEVEKAPRKLEFSTFIVPPAPATGLLGADNLDSCQQLHSHQQQQQQNSADQRRMRRSQDLSIGGNSPPSTHNIAPEMILNEMILMRQQAEQRSR